MTVPSSTAKSGPYLCNGVTDVFNYGFRIVDKSHLNVILADANGVETTLSLTTHYTVSDVGEDTGSINLTAAGVALAVTGTTLTILRNPPFTQETDLQNQGAYLAQTVEDRFDLLTMQIQTVKERSDRSIAAPASDEDTTLDDLTADLVRLADSADNIDTVAARDADIATVADRDADIGTVAARDADIGTVADRDADIGIVAGISSDVSTVAGISDDVSTVAGIADKIPDLAGVVFDDDIGTGSDLSTDPDKLAKRGDVSDFVDLLSVNTFNVIAYILIQPGGFAEIAKIKSGDTATQDAAIVTAGIQAAVDAAKVSGTPATVYFPSGKYRTNDQISTAGATTSLLMVGEGEEQSILYLDFEGASLSGVLFSDDYTISNGIAGIGFLGRNDALTNNPIGLLALKQTNFTYRDVVVRGLRNSGAVFVGLTNSRLTDFLITAGYQPIDGYQPETAPTCDVTGTTITVDTTETIFDASSVGKEIQILGAGAKQRLKVFQTRIAAVSDGQTATLEDSAPTTISDTKWCWGAVRGSMTSGGDTLTLDNGVLDANDVGRFVTVRLVQDFSTGQGYSRLVEGARTFTIGAVSSPTTCTLLDLDGTPASVNNTVASVEVFFAPGMAFYQDYSSTTFHDDIVIEDSRIERHEGPGIIAQNISAFRIGNTVKIHGKGWDRTNTVNMPPRNPCAIFASDVLDAVFEANLAYSSSRYVGGGQIVVEAARGAVVVSSPGSTSKCDGGKIVSAHEVTHDFRLILGNIYDNDEAPDDNRGVFYVGLDAGDAQIKGTSLALGYILQVGEYVPRLRQISLTGGVNRTPGYSSASRWLTDKDNVISFYPPETRGTIEIFSSRANVYGRFKFRTSDNQSAAQLVALGTIGSEVAVSGTNGVNTLTGTTGTDLFVNISVDGTTGQIHIENRVSNDHDLTWTILT